MKLHELKPAPGSTHRRRRVGRGNASGLGTFSGRGCKGQGARSGGLKGKDFEGGQTSFLRRTPKLKGFKNPNHINFIVLNTGDLESNFSAGETVNLETLKEKGLIKRVKPIKLLNKGPLTKKLDITCAAASATAQKAVSSAGGTLTLTLKKDPTPSKKSEASS